MTLMSFHLNEELQHKDCFLYMYILQFYILISETKCQSLDHPMFHHQDEHLYYLMIRQTTQPLGR
jgi:hypothetical protein